VSSRYVQVIVRVIKCYFLRLGEAKGEAEIRLAKYNSRFLFVNRVSYNGPMLAHVAVEMAKNVIKGAFPDWITRLRGQTGRGKGRQTPKEILDYGRSVFTGALADIGVREPGPWGLGKTVVELGPGDTLVSGLHFIAYGAVSYTAVDRFAFHLESDLNRQVYKLLIESLQGEPRARLERHLGETGGFGVDGKKLKVLRVPAETFQLEEAADLVLSQSVLEHTSDLPAVFARMSEALRPGGWMSHGVDLSDHGLYPGSPYRFLEFSPRLWSAMHRFRGSPNRARLGEYRELCKTMGLEWTHYRAAQLETLEAARAAKPKLSAEFQAVPDEDLRVMSFRFTARKP
jgi:SAM-dependent methyltransferase